MMYFIKTFGCQQNVADSERLASYYHARGYSPAKNVKQADTVVINTCMIRQSAVDRVTGLVYNLLKERRKGRLLKIVVTGCMVGMAAREKTGKMLSVLHKKMPAVDEFLPIEEVGFELNPYRGSKDHAYVPISNGCNNYCTYCVVPFTRGREISRPYMDIIKECEKLAEEGYSYVTLLGQNVNSYGADLLIGENNVQAMRDLPDKKYFSQKTDHKVKQCQKIQILGKTNSLKSTYVKHLGRLRIPTLFPQLLGDICKIEGIKKIDFMSSNPWDFSDDLINVIVDNPKISRELHIAVQSGDTKMLKKMNRWYTRSELIKLIKTLKKRIPDLKISTDIIVGFCGETEKQFENTVNLCQKVGFSKAYISMYSDRPMTAAHKVYKDNVPIGEKKRRWLILEKLVNKVHHSEI